MTDTLERREAMQDAIERFLADFDDNDRAEAGFNPLMEAHVAAFRAALALTTSPRVDEGVREVLADDERLLIQPQRFDPKTEIWRDTTDSDAERWMVCRNSHCGRFDIRPYSSRAQATVAIAEIENPFPASRLSGHEGEARALATPPADPRVDRPTNDERLLYERRIVAAECGTQRILNALYGYLKWSEHQARFNTDTLDPKAAEILANLAERVRGFDVIAFNEKEVGVATDLWENGEPHISPADPEPTRATPSDTLASALKPQTVALERDAVAQVMGAALPTEYDWQHIRQASGAFVERLAALHTGADKQEDSDGPPSTAADQWRSTSDTGGDGGAGALGAERRAGGADLTDKLERRNVLAEIDRLIDVWQHSGVDACHTELPTLRMVREKMAAMDSTSPNSDTLDWRVPIAREVKDILRGPDGEEFTDAGMEDAFFRWPVIERAILALSLPARGGGRAERVHEVMDEGDGFWRACSGCQESSEGAVSKNDYPYSLIFRCQPGGGCGECGGIGVIWDDTDYAEMARAMLADDALATTPADLRPPPECPYSPNGRHQVNASMETGSDNCFFCQKPMGRL